MKKILIFFILISTLSVSAQTDSVVYYDSLKVYRIDTAIIYGQGTGIDTVTSDSNFVWCYYHYIQTTSDSFLYQPQFVIYDSLNNKLLPNVDMGNNGWRSSGTVKEWYIDSAKAAQTPDSLRTFYILPNLQSIYGSSNVTKL